MYYKITVLLLGFCCQITQANTLQGLARVVDADTLVIDSQTIRLIYIDALELYQPVKSFKGNHTLPLGVMSAAFLFHTIYNKPLTCKLFSTDSFGRGLAECFVEGVNLNQLLVKKGMALVYWPKSPRLRKHYQVPNAYRLAEESAKKGQLGVWGYEFEMPIDYRSNHRNRKGKSNN